MLPWLPASTISQHWVRNDHWQILYQLTTCQHLRNVESTLSLIRLLRLRLDSINDAAGFVIEYRTSTSSAIRFLFSELEDPQSTNGNYNYIFYQAEYLRELAVICDPNGWCPFDKYLALIVADIGITFSCDNALSCASISKWTNLMITWLFQNSFDDLSLSKSVSH